MPIYEYRCEACARVTSVFIRRPASHQGDVTCEHCGSTKMRRKMSAVMRSKSTQDVLDEYGVPQAPGDYRDPRQIGSWVERRFQEYGVDMPAETREMIDRAREGEMKPDMDIT